MTEWRLAPLASLGKIVTGSTPKTADPGNYGGRTPFVTPSDLGSLDPIVKAGRSLSVSGTQSARLIPAGSVLVCCIGATLGKTGIAGRQLSTNQQINAVTFAEDLIFPRYGLHALHFFKQRLRTLAPATTLPIVSKSKFEKFEIPVPPLPRQRHIADVLDRVDYLQAKRRESLAALETLAAAVFFCMFGDVTSNDRGWDNSRVLGDVAQVISGVTKGRVASGPLAKVPYVTVINVQDKRLDLSTIKEIDVTAAELERYRLRRDDLLLTEGGDPDKLGRGTLWRDEIPLCIHQNHIFRVRINERSEISPVYLNWLTSSELGRRYFLRSAKQTTGIASINATQLRQFPLLIPPADLQYEFAQRLSGLEKVQSAQKQHLNELGDLLASLQHHAFRGELLGAEVTELA